jgi:hypothetical protein
MERRERLTELLRRKRRSLHKDKDYKFNSNQFNRLLLGFLTINIRVSWLFNHSIPLVFYGLSHT